MLTQCRRWRLGNACGLCVCRLAIERETGVRMDQVDPKALAFVVAGYDLQPVAHHHQQLNDPHPTVLVLGLGCSLCAPGNWG